MGFKKNKKETAYFNGALEVTNIRVVTDSMVSFTLKSYGFALFNMRLIEKKDGSGYFIVPPADKGRDGKYYNRYVIYLDDEREKAIVDQILKELDNE